MALRRKYARMVFIAEKYGNRIEPPASRALWLFERAEHLIGT
jgi:hypothetical protein